MSKSKRFKPPIPKGMRIFEQGVSVAGVKHRFYDAKMFARRSNQSIYMERDPNNQHDPNAIKIMGKSKGWFFEVEKCIGYIPAGLAKLIVSKGMEERVQVRLREIFIGDREYVGISFDILGPKKDYS